MITTISEHLYNILEPRPELHNVENFTNGNVLPYSGYIEAFVVIPGISKHEIVVSSQIQNTT